MYIVLLFYKLRKISHPDHEVKKHKEVCKALGLRGRVLIDDRGINGTVAGDERVIALYKDYMNKHRLFTNIDFKESESTFMPFPRLQVKKRKEMIATHAKEDIDLGNRGKHINRDTFHKWLKQDEDIVIIDMRNDYEWEVGRFKGAIKPPVNKFYELKDHMDYYEKYKDKKVVMYCTGGIRCEPASAYFIKHGFDKENLYQLEGGIVKYGEKYGDEGFFEGKCFVFDDRITVPVNRTDTAVVVGTCYLCDTPCDMYRNCMNKHCNRLYLCCDECSEKMHTTCQESCKQAIRDTDNIRSPRLSN